MFGAKIRKISHFSSENCHFNSHKNSRILQWLVNQNSLIMAVIKQRCVHKVNTIISLKMLQKLHLAVFILEELKNES